MGRARPLALSFALAAVLAAGTAPRVATAEGFLDLYLGAGFPQNDSIETSTSISGLGLSGTRRADFETTPSFGLRGGYWFEEATPFLGIGLDLSYYRAFEDRSTAPIDFYVLPMTPLLFVRIPIATAEGFPGGRVQPYGAVGPSFNLSFADGDLSELGTGLDDFADVSFDVGLDVRGGLAIQLSRRFAVFSEYRYSYFEPEYDDEVDFPGPDVDVDIDAELATHHVLFGLSFRF